MNVHDSEKIAGILESDDYVETSMPKDADFIIINTCSIRQKAEQKFYSLLGRIKPLKKLNPRLKIAVTGCIAQQEGGKLLKRVPFVDYVIGPQNIHLFKNASGNKSHTIAIDDNPEITEMELTATRKAGVSAWINIMYGCNNFCSYCIVPYTRGRERSRASDNIINEIKALADNGYKEVTLLGQNVNSYKSSLDFPGLLSEINKISGLNRIRFVTSHPKDITNELINNMRDLEKVCEHIHLPLQSGSTRILGLMNRKYTYEDYLSKVESLRNSMNEISITSDMIIGFPQETDDDHTLSVKALKEVCFDGIFAFNFSQRTKTKASEMEGQIPDHIKSERLSEILDLQNNITELKNKELEGSIQEILVDGVTDKNKEIFTGKTRTNKIVTIPSRSDIHIGDIVNVKISKANRHSLEGICPI